MNQINIIGRVGGEVELRYTPSGKAVAEVNIAVDDGWGDNKKTIWLGVTMWGVTAELAAKAVQKGDKLGVSGRLTQDEWEDKTTGQKRTKIKVTCDSMTLLSPKRDEAIRHQPEARQASRPHTDVPVPQADDEDDIPF
jgi:single-strand DNA-binding protein